MCTVRLMCVVVDRGREAVRPLKIDHESSRKRYPPRLRPALWARLPHTSSWHLTCPGDRKIKGGADATHSELAIDYRSSCGYHWWIRRPTVERFKLVLVALSMWDVEETVS